MSSASQDYYETAPPSPLLASPFKKKTMSITQTYYLAHKARAKLSSEASRPDHNLRLLVGHANLLDSLMLELHDAEREQESWFNQSVRSAAKEEQPARRQHITWADQIIEEEEPEEDWEIEDSSSDDSSDDEYDSDGDFEMADAIPLYRVASHSNSYVPVPQQSQQKSIDVMAVEEEDKYEENYAQLTLVRSPSHTHSPPPELDEDDDSEDDDSMPASPPNPPLPDFNDKQATTTAFFSPSSSSSESSLYDHQEFFIPQRNPARLVSAISVY